MGASGAGKTSLMNALSDRIALSRTSQMQGKVLLNDCVEQSYKVFGSNAVYVMQDDVLFESFTVEEALTFAARLRLKCSEWEQDGRIVQLMKDLGLMKVKDTLCGSTTKKTISGGERKRTAIGVELITNPSVVLLDEPTSGLDSHMAKKICKILQDLAHNQGKTVISTIHQPSSEAFFFFDRLLLMCDGYTVYQGRAKNAPRYFSEIGYPISGFCNPADKFMAVLSINYPKGK
jgi:ATP-binding cassette subfamily G (WHITE) protein 2